MEKICQRPHEEALLLISLGHSRGAFSQFVVNATSGVLLTEITMMLATIFRSKSIAAVILVLAAFLITTSSGRPQKSN